MSDFSEPQVNYCQHKRRLRKRLKEKVTLNPILKDRKASQMQRAEGGGTVKVLRQRELQKKGLPKPSRKFQNHLRAARATWPRSICSVVAWGWGTPYPEPNLSTPWAQRRKTEARPR